MSASASKLSDLHYGYDFVVAVTQASINATMEQFLSTVKEPVVSVCYVLGGDNTPTQIDYQSFLKLSNGTDPFTMPTGADPDGADFKNLMKARFVAGFKAQLGLPQASNGGVSFQDMVTLTSDISTVQYNMYCSEFVICEIAGGLYTAPSFTSTSQSSDDPWRIQSTVNLNLSTVGQSAYAGLPQAIQKQINNMSSTAFSIQQLLFDLNSAKLAKMPTIENSGPGSTTFSMLEQFFTGAYFAAMQTGDQPLLGCTIVPQIPDASNLTITDMNLMVNQYIDSSTGKPQEKPSYLQESLSTLNYLCAVDNDKLPPSTQFAWNWLEAGDLGNFDGILAINRNCFRDYFNQSLVEYMPNVCFAVDAHCIRSGLGSDMSVDLTPGQQPTLNTSDGATVLSYSYHAHDYDEAGENGDIGSLSVDTTFDLTTQFTELNGSACVIVIQHLVIGINMKKNFTRTSGNVVDKTLTDYYTLAVDDTGKLSATLATTVQDKSATPTTDGFSDFFTHSNEVAADIKKYANSIASSNLQDIPLSVMQKFIFPGGRTFTFKDVRFSHNQDLLSSISYVDPTSSPPTVPV